ncbi:MAG TPA: arginine deiminase-related protein [Gemmatimonadales bacterium]|nr:arginine deiminase-related protein [Gemmatimonadales bacterium]
MIRAQAEQILTAVTPAPSTPAESQSRPLNPTQLGKPAFLLAVPFSLSTEVANNPRMEDLPADRRGPDARKAMRQWLDLYHFVASEAVVYLLPSPGDCELQDLVFTANLGAVLDHLPDRNTAVVSNFRSPPRVAEAPLGLAFFESLGYTTARPPHKFEGEAELKHLHDNVYAGGYGIRSDIEAYEWMARRFDMKIVTLEETDGYLYHLDCTVFPVTRDDTLVCTELYAREELAELERHTNIIDVSADDCYAGICNSVRLSNTILNASHVRELQSGTDDYAAEVAKNRRLEDIAVSLGFDLSFFNLSEYHKSGALLSCMLLHLNHRSYEFALT